MATASSACAAPAAHRDKVDLVIDPKTADIDGLVRDILRVCKEVIDLLPGATLQSVQVRDRFASVEVRSGGGRELAIQLIKKDDAWAVRSCRFCNRR